MTDLRDRIVAAIYKDNDFGWSKYMCEEAADAVLAELGRRRCERCKHDVPLDEFPLPHEGSDVMRHFCIQCTNYVEWSTS